MRARDELLRECACLSVREPEVLGRGETRRVADSHWSRAAPTSREVFLLPRVARARSVFFSRSFFLFYYVLLLFLYLLLFFQFFRIDTSHNIHIDNNIILRILNIIIYYIIII